MYDILTKSGSLKLLMYTIGDSHKCELLKIVSFLGIMYSFSKHWRARQHSRHWGHETDEDEPVNSAGGDR